MFTWNCKGRLVVVNEPMVMGILNLTPDSFYTGSRLSTIDAVLTKAEKMIVEGAAILDMGGQSTRPGSQPISVEDELKRVLPAIEAVHRRWPEQLISIDTYYAKLAREAVAAGASIVNDVSAGSLDEALLETVAALKVPYVLMHMKGDPENMQKDPVYENVTLDVFDHLNRKLAACHAAGIHDVIVDPGFGFGKTAAHNFQLLNELSFFNRLNCPLLVGLSRKGMVYKSLGVSPEESLNGTTALHTVALQKGAQILRVHDVKEAVEVIKLHKKLQN